MCNRLCFGSLCENRRPLEISQANRRAAHVVGPSERSPSPLATTRDRSYRRFSLFPTVTFFAFAALLTLHSGLVTIKQSITECTVSKESKDCFMSILDVCTELKEYQFCPYEEINGCPPRLSFNLESLDGLTRLKKSDSLICLTLISGIIKKYQRRKANVN